MFYSHQLLSKKGQFSHIWIAATLHQKMNRKRADQVDIQASCMQIINPEVPLALRLSGILMGGIVRIYDHKVKFFYDDVTQFMIKMKTKTPTKSADATTLPPRKTRAKFEAITEEENLEDECELPMLEPETPDQDEFFTVPSPVKRSKAPASNKFQADNEDITLEEDNLRSFSGLDDTERVESQERFQMPESFMDDFDMYTPPDVQGTFPVRGFVDPNPLEPIVEEERTEAEATEPAEAPAAAAGGAAGDQDPKTPKPRKAMRSRKKPKLIIDEEITEIPTQVFQAWLSDTSDITHRKQRRKLYTGMAAERAKAMLSNPSAFLTRSSKTCLPESLLPDPLAQLWNAKPPRVRKPGEPEAKKQKVESPSTDNLQSSELNSSPDNEELNAKAPTFDFEEPEQFEAPLRFEDFGSVEKLRSVAPTPSEDPFFHNPMGFTPTFSGNSGMNAKRGMSAHSEKLQPDDFSTPKLKRTRSRQRSVSPLGAEILGHDVFPDTRSPDISVAPEAEPSRAARQRELDKLTGMMLQYLREHFKNTSGAKDLSLELLTDGMDPSQAAKMFYHVCVLASNRYLQVSQKQAYDDIIISRGSLF